MSANHMIITEQVHARFMAVLESIDREANAKMVFLVDKSGQPIATVGEIDTVDPTSLASLTAGNVAATEGVAELVGEEGFTNLFHEGRNGSLHITVVANHVILAVLFDERSSLGLVRLRVEQQVPELGAIVQELLAPTEPPQPVDAEAVGQITDADIDALFGN
jgi:predicted regulator of Ras-like GTPase activity (Roadblock/LC7/MglB family)